MNSLVTLEVAKQCHGSQNTNEEHSEILQIAAAHYKMSHSFRDSDFTAKIANFLPVKICMNRVTVACIKQLYSELMNLAYDNQLQSFVWCALCEWSSSCLFLQKEWVSMVSWSTSENTLIGIR